MTVYRPWSQLSEPERTAVRLAFPDVVWAEATWHCTDGRWHFQDPR